MSLGTRNKHSRTSKTPQLHVYTNIRGTIKSVIFTEESLYSRLLVESLLVVLNRPITHLDGGRLPENQCHFREGLGIVDMIFATRHLQEKCQELKYN